MEVRLAYERGLLTQRSLSYFQHWALLYHMYLERRIKLEDTDSILERQTLNLNPDMWVRLYRNNVIGQLGVADETAEPEIELTENDLDALDAFMDKQEEAFRKALSGTHTMTGASNFNPAKQADPLAWSEWQ